MPFIEFQLLLGENILYRASPDRKWYVVTWKIGSGIAGIIILTFIVFSLLAGPTQSAFILLIPAWAAGMLIKFLYLGLVPLAAAVWVTDEVACSLIGQFILTDQRIWIRGSPYAWSHSSIRLDDIALVTWRRDAIFIKQRSSQKMQVHMFSDGKLFLKAYEQIIGKPKTS